MTPACLRATAARLASGAVTSAELTRLALAPDELGATERRLDSARRLAAAADERRAAGAPRSGLDGIPFAVKANIDIAGVPTSAGTALTMPPATRDAAAAAALRAAGLIPARTATLAELAFGSVTDNPHTGPCRNPADPRLAAGGSSGGSAALVAAGLVPLALGSDTMGSVRIPAAYCGVAAWKPSRGLLSLAGLVPLHPWLDTIGVIAAHAHDLLLAAPLLAPGVLGEQAAGRLVIGVPGLAGLADADGQAALGAALAGLRGLGHEVRLVDLSLSLDLAAIRLRGLLLCEADTYRRFQAATDSGDRGLSERVRGLLAYGGRAAPERVAAAERDLRQAAEAIQAVFGQADVLVLPVTPEGPPPVGTEPPHAGDLTAWVNVAGLPAVSLPAGPRARGGIPRGIQLVGPPGADGPVLALAARLEAALGPAGLAGSRPGAAGSAGGGPGTRASAPGPVAPGADADPGAAATRGPAPLTETR